MGPLAVKYMGSKRALLENALGKTLRNELRGARRFVDLFCGTGAVSEFVGKRNRVPVLASDLQEFAVVLTRATVGRARPLDPERIWAAWLTRARKHMAADRTFKAANNFQTMRWEPARVKSVEHARRISSSSPDPIVRGYGGHYFSPLQALTISSLRVTVPQREPERSCAIAALVRASSSCAAAPGHTAQPFAPTRRAAPYLFAAWRKDVQVVTREALFELAPVHARVAGRCTVAEALAMARRVRVGDVVFVDPPYSDVQYSRFYHVLETVARGNLSAADGVGRYPPRSERPQSDYSKKSRSRSALRGLLDVLADRHVKVILTFPGSATNGLSASAIRRMAEKRFRVTWYSVDGRFSTLGGNGSHRPARLPSLEFVMVLRPRRALRSAAVPSP